MWFVWTYNYGILFVVICVHLRGSGTSGGNEEWWCIGMWLLRTYHYGISFVVICVHLRGSGTCGGIVEMVGYRYGMWLQYRVVCNVSVFALCPLPLSF